MKLFYLWNLFIHTNIYKKTKYNKSLSKYLCTYLKKENYKTKQKICLKHTNCLFCKTSY